jgi:hypothetical protein
VLCILQVPLTCFKNTVLVLIFHPPFLGCILFHAVTVIVLSLKIGINWRSYEVGSFWNGSSWNTAKNGPKPNVRSMENWCTLEKKKKKGTICVGLCACYISGQLKFFSIKLIINLKQVVFSSYFILRFQIKSIVCTLKQ